MNNNGKKKKKNGGEDEVEQLLQAAQDELLLKMSVDSHTHRRTFPPRGVYGGDSLLPDLDRRFRALKSPNKNNQLTIPSKTTTTTQQQPHVDVDEDDLLARFATLKASSSSSTCSTQYDQGYLCTGDDDQTEDEVEKIIRWAKDAARLDPSPPSDDDADDDSDEDITDNDDHQDTINNNRVDKRKNPIPPK